MGEKSVVYDYYFHTYMDMEQKAYIYIEYVNFYFKKDFERGESFKIDNISSSQQ